MLSFAYFAVTGAKLVDGLEWWLRVPDAMQRVPVHRRSGTFAELGVRDDPGSAAHHFVLRRARETFDARAGTRKSPA